MSIYSKTAAGWVEVAGGSSKAALSSWGRVVGEPEGAVTSTYFKNDDGSQWQYWEFNTEGTYEIDLGNGGLFWVLCVGGGDGGAGTQSVHSSNGVPGLVREGLWEFGPGTHSVTVGTKGGTNNNTWGQPSFIDDVLTGFSTQGVSSWGNAGYGRGVNYAGYVSLITGNDLEYAPKYNGPDRPGRAGFDSGEQRDGTVIIATRIDVEQLAPAPAELAPAPVLGAPVKVSGSSDVVEYIVRQTDGSRKKIYMLPGATGSNGTLPHPENVFEVTLGAGVLPGVMVGAGGTGGQVTGSNKCNGAGGAGGVIGQGAHVPVILPVQGTATYTVTVGSTTPQGARWYEGHYAQHTTIAVQGQTPFISAVGGGRGIAQDTNVSYGTSGGSGGGGQYPVTSSGDPIRQASSGIPGQGHSGNYLSTSGYGTGGGGGYGSGNEQTSNGGAGFDLAFALQLDSNDGPTAAFLDAVSVDGWIAGGGAGGGGTATAGGGAYGGGAGKDYSGAGGAAGGTGRAGNGGCGAVYIITDV